MTAIKIIIGWQVISFVILIILGILSWAYYDKRYKKSETKVPTGYIWTEEVSIDAVTGKKERVYYNPNTGDRFYKEEK
jgi:heme/copper-type cytochrome/quinol oxidase subunit 2